MALLGIKDDSSTTFLQLKYLILSWLQQLVHVTLQFNISGLIKKL